MDTYPAAYWSSDPSRLSSSDEEEENLYCYTVFVYVYFVHKQSKTSLYLGF